MYFRIFHLNNQIFVVAVTFNIYTYIYIYIYIYDRNCELLNMLYGNWLWIDNTSGYWSDLKYLAHYTHIIPLYNATHWLGFEVCNVGQ